jgi:transcription initiation factor TFIID TATA-box-binding protein
MKNDDLTISNVVGGGDLKRNIDLLEIYEKISISDVEYEPEHFPGLIVKFQNPKATVMLFASGKYNIAGAKSISDARDASLKIISIIESIIGDNIESNDFEIRFVVCTTDLGIELDLNKVMIALGIEETEYEPEQFPALYYRPENEEWFALLFRTGKVIIEGGPDLGVLENGFRTLKGRLDI